MASIESILITGANAGLGKEAARLLALRLETKRVLLGCRNVEKAEAAKRELEQSTGKNVFEVVIMDVSDVAGVRKWVDELSEPIDAVILNAGGIGGSGSDELTSDGVQGIFAVNVLGNAALLHALLEQRKLRAVAVYASSEVVRGIPFMGFDIVKLPENSVNDYKVLATGEEKKFDRNQRYGDVKYFATMWMSALARAHPEIKIVSVSPGMTTGTNAFDDLPAILRAVFKTVASPLLKLFGRAHGVTTGAQRYIDVMIDDKYVSGRFYASSYPGTTGPLVDQADFHQDITNETYQGNALEAIRSFL